MQGFWYVLGMNDGNRTQDGGEVNLCVAISAKCEHFSNKNTVSQTSEVDGEFRQMSTFIEHT